MRCKEVMELLDAYRTRELDTHNAQGMSEHLAGCDACADELRAIERFAGQTAGQHAPAPAGLLDHVLDETQDSFGEVKTEIGNVLVAFNRRGITMVYLGETVSSGFEKYYERRRGRHVRHATVPDVYAHVVRQAAGGHQPDKLPVDLEGLPPFEQSVLQMLTKIPRGQVRPYRWLAREAGRPNAVRAVGNTMARNPIPLLLPCHRVVPAQGGVGNYAFGSRIKRELLLREGVPVDELDELASQRIRFLGCKSTRIYCFPTCRDARRMLPSNRVPFSDEKEACLAGYRPCRHCRPEAIAS